MTPEATQTRYILNLYHLYRLIIGLVLVWLLTSNLLTSNHPDVLQQGVWGYLILNAMAALGLRYPHPPFVLAVALLDLLLLLGLFYLAGGTSSGLGSLIVVAVAIANVLIRGRMGLFLAAAASIGLTYSAFYLGLDAPQGLANSQRIQAGTLGALCFMAAALVQELARRLHATENLARQRARDVASLETLNALILQRLHTGILVLDDQYHVLLANPPALTLLGVTTLTGEPLAPFCPELIQRITEWQHNPSRPANRLETASGIVLQPNFIALSPNEGHLLIFLEDQSVIAQHAQQLKLASLGRLTASIAHEIRNPLGAISHAAQLLLESEVLTNTDRRLAQIIQDQSQRMNLIIENVLQLSRRRQADPHTLDLVPWLQQFVDNLRPRLEAEQSVQLHNTESSLMTGMDATQLEQVVMNLVQNALRYGRPPTGNGQVELHLSRDPHTALPILEVLDNGTGVPPEQVQHIFEPFFTTDSQGTGLGLYLCRELCESNQAHIHYQPRLGGGSCFRITFAHPSTLDTSV